MTIKISTKFSFAKTKVYIKEEELNLENDEVLDEDLLNYKVIINNDIGFIKEVFLQALLTKY